jgi:hypothetical protein
LKTISMFVYSHEDADKLHLDAYMLQSACIHT